MPLEVPFSPSIVLAVVVVVDIVYVVSRGRSLSLYPPPTSPRLENPLTAKCRTFYIRDVEFFHGFRLALRRSFSQTARVCAHVLYTRAMAAALSSVGVITFAFLLTLHHRTESHQNTWEIKTDANEAGSTISLF